MLGVLSTMLALTGCGSRETLRYKLTAQIETPEGVRTGYSVIQVVWTRSGPVDKALFGGLAGGGFQVKGEAVAVGLPKGQTVFVLLRSAGSVDWAGWASNDVPKDGTVRTVPRTDNMGTANIPYFVRFTNPADPKTVEQVDPDNLAKTYGAGYALKSLTVQMTGEPVTTGIEGRLAWLTSGSWMFFQERRDSKTGTLLPPEKRTVAHDLNDGYFWRKK